MGLFTKRRVYVLFLAITVLQIVTTGVRQIFDFLGPQWAMIFTNFLNIVFAIFGFFGGYTRRKHYLISYVVWSMIWSAWNLFIVCLYIPVPTLELYKSTILSLGTGGFSWWETRAPGCVPDWASESQLLVTNCLFDPHLVECIQAGLQVYLACIGVITGLSVVVCPHYRESDKDSKNGDPKNRMVGNSVPTFFSVSRGSNHTMHSRSSSRSHSHHRAPIGIPTTSATGDSSDQVGNNVMDDRLRPMTPRRVKRRSARSIQSQRFGPSTQNQNATERELSRGTSAGSSGRNSLRSNSSSRRSSNHRNSKRKTNHFVSPVNRILQQVDSETSHDEPHRYPLRDQGHLNPVYLGPHSPQQPPPPPRPPSARSSYSNYHPARIPINSPMSPNLNPNVFNLNQNIFANPAFDNSTEYNASQHSNNTNNTFYEDDIQFNLDHPSQSHIPHPQMPRQIINNFTFNPNNQLKTNNPTLVYPLAHSPVSQESYPMWGVAQAQVPASSNVNHLHNQHLPLPSRLYSQQPSNSETVI